MTESSIWIVPSIGFGNVGQFVVDLLLANDTFKPPVALDAPFVLPVVGSCSSLATGSGHFVTELDLSVLQANDRLHVVQQRSPVRSNANGKHARHLMQTITADSSRRPAAVVLLHSVHAALQLDAALYVPTDERDAASAERPQFGCVTNAAFDALFPDGHPLLAQLPRLPRDSPSILTPRSFPQFFVDHASDEHIPLVVLVSFSNGNGMQESFVLFSVLHALLAALGVHVAVGGSSPSAASSSTGATRPRAALTVPPTWTPHLN